MAKETISPQAFYSDHPPDRIIGVECEYNIQEAPSNSHISLDSYISGWALRRAGLLLHQEYNTSSYLNNGGRIYVDVGHLEYATAECLGPKQAAAADLAGILLMQDIVTASQRPYQGLYRFTGTTITKSDGTTKNETSGTHENYLIPRAVSEGDLIDRWLPGYLATRLFAMTGTVSDTFEFSQKINGIGGSPIDRSLDRRISRGKKPMIIIPSQSSDQGTIGSNNWARVEVRFSDAPIFPLASFLRLGATSLVLRLVEHPHFFNKKLSSNVELADPLLAARIFSKDLTLTKTVKTQDDKSVSLKNIQEAYVLGAIKLSQEVELPKDENEALDLWIKFCTDLSDIHPDRLEYGDMHKHFDFAARHLYLGRRSLQPISHSSQTVVQQNLIWDRILPSGGGLLFRAAQTERVITAADIQARKYTAPNTRAKIRSDVINSTDKEYKVLNWSTLIGRRSVNIVLADSYQTKL